MNFDFWFDRGFEVVPLIPSNQLSAFPRLDLSKKYPGFRKLEKRIWEEYEIIPRSTKALRKEWTSTFADVGIELGKVIAITFEGKDVYILNELIQITKNHLGSAPRIIEDQYKISLIYRTSDHFETVKILAFEQLVPRTISSHADLQVLLQPSGYLKVGGRSQLNKYLVFPDGIPSFRSLSIINSKSSRTLKPLWEEYLNDEGFICSGSSINLVALQ